MEGKKVWLEAEGTCYNITNKNIKEIAELIKETYNSTNQEIEVICYEELGEIDIDNKTFCRVDVCCVGDCLVITDNSLFIYPTKEEMDFAWNS